jgi:cytochrome d ubiquinol oxidase subunit I
VVTGLEEFPVEDRPPVNIVFQTYHAMVAIGMGLIGLSVLGLFLWWRGRLWQTGWMLRLMVIAVLGPQLANQLGWMSAEIGRQPWVVYRLMRTSEGLSQSLQSEHVLFSLILFTFVYLLLFAVFVFLLDQKIKHGPLMEDEPEASLQRA